MTLRIGNKITIKDVESRLDYLWQDATLYLHEGSLHYDEITHWREQLHAYFVYKGHGLEYEFEEYNG